MVSLNRQKCQEEVGMVFPEGEAGVLAEGTEKKHQEGEEQEKENLQGQSFNSLDDTDLDKNDATTSDKEVRKLTKRPTKLLDKNVYSQVSLGTEECDQSNCICKGDRDNSTPNPNGLRWKEAFQAANARLDLEWEVFPLRGN